jgi:hypothetical protein
MCLPPQLGHVRGRLLSSAMTLVAPLLPRPGTHRVKGTDSVVTHGPSTHLYHIPLLPYHTSAPRRGGIPGDRDTQTSASLRCAPHNPGNVGEPGHPRREYNSLAGEGRAVQRLFRAPECPQSGLRGARHAHVVSPLSDKDRRSMWGIGSRTTRRPGGQALRRSNPYCVTCLSPTQQCRALRGTGRERRA